MPLETLIDDAREEIEVTEDELDEARDRRRKIATALLAAFPGSRIYVNGSIAHGDAITPLNDIDVGVVVADAAKHYGPGRRGPRDLMERARDAIRDHLGKEFPKLTVTIEGQRRAVLVRFGDPVTAGQQDFTADVIVAIDNPDEPGLFIPNLFVDGLYVNDWERSDPETHLELVKAAIKATEVVFARTVRLLKYWSRRHSKPMCSWNIKVLALDCVTEPMPLAEAMEAFFRYAAEALKQNQGLTPDPAHVAGPIELNLPTREVIARLHTAKGHITRALEHEAAGRAASAQHELAMLLPDIVPDADPSEVAAEEAARLTGTTKTGTSVGVGAGSTLRIPSSRAWAPR
jgi:predicted nucleotidyltransferase